MVGSSLPKARTGTVPDVRSSILAGAALVWRARSRLAPDGQR
ncbi:hypothetical protein [Micromonospora sp. NPDC049301]